MWTNILGTTQPLFFSRVCAFLRGIWLFAQSALDNLHLLCTCWTSCVPLESDVSNALNRGHTFLKTTKCPVWIWFAVLPYTCENLIISEMFCSWHRFTHIWPSFRQCPRLYPSHSPDIYVRRILTLCVIYVFATIHKTPVYVIYCMLQCETFRGNLINCVLSCNSWGSV